MTDRYVLDGKTPVPCPDLLEWALWLECAERQVADTLQGDTRVSTVFLGLDHSFGHGPPLLFETMVFRNGRPTDRERYATWDEAEAGHRAHVARTFSKRLEDVRHEPEG